MLLPPQASAYQDFCREQLPLMRRELPPRTPQSVVFQAVSRRCGRAGGRVAPARGGCGGEEGGWAVPTPLAGSATPTTGECLRLGLRYLPT